MKYLVDSAGRKFIYTHALLNRGGFELVDDEAEKPTVKRTAKTRRGKTEPKPDADADVATALEDWES